MKWHDADKYIPLEGVYLFIRTGENKLHLGKYEYGEYLYLDNIRIPDVTHFCIPDPIEIEE